MEERSAGISADSTCSYALVVGPKPGGRALGRSGDPRAGEGSCAERAHHAENFVVAPSWIERRLEDKIGRLIKGVVCLVVVESGEVARRSNQGVLSLEFAAESGLRIFDRHRDTQLIVCESLRDPETVLTRPTEAHVILRVNRHWASLC